MGSIIKENTEGEPSAALTETGSGGLLSQGYLRDAPAREYLGDGETAVFVLTDEEVGVERARGSERTRISPGKGYRTITVVTDRRVIVLVGNADDDGDRRITLPLVETADVRADDGTLVLEMRSGIAWHCHADPSGIEEVAAYVDAAADTWRDVERSLDTIKRAIVDATGHRDAGDYDAALGAIREARDGIEEVQKRTEAFATEWPGEAMVDRVGKIRDSCLRTAAEIRVGYARATIDEGEEHWRESAYERAREAFEDARGVFEAVRSLPARHRTDIDDVEPALARLDRRLERLDDAPLRNAIDADRRALESEPGLGKLDLLAEARERYDVVLDLESDDGERRCVGDRERVRDQREDVIDRLVETAREVAAAAMDAAEWYCAADQTELAVAEFERAIEALGRGVAIAETERPPAADDLRRRRATVRGRLDELSDDEGGSMDGEAGGVRDECGDVGGETRESADAVPDGAPDGGPVVQDDGPNDVPDDVEVSDATEGDTAAADGGVASLPAVVDHAAPGGMAPGAASRTSSVTPPSTETRLASENGTAENGTVEKGTVESGTAEDGPVAIERMLGDLEPAQFEHVVTAVVEAMGWRPKPTASAACDYLAEPMDGDGPTLAVRSLPDDEGNPIEEWTIEECADLAISVPTVDDVAIVTTRPLTDPAIAAARERRIRLVDLAYLARVLGRPGTEAARRTGFGAPE